jgi:hypothetical protein
MANSDVQVSASRVRSTLDSRPERHFRSLSVPTPKIIASPCKRDFTAWKYRMLDLALPLPTHRPSRAASAAQRSAYNATPITVSAQIALRKSGHAGSADLRSSTALVAHSQHRNRWTSQSTRVCESPPCVASRNAQANVRIRLANAGVIIEWTRLAAEIRRSYPAATRR